MGGQGDDHLALLPSQAAGLGLLVAAHAAGLDSVVLGGQAGGKTFLTQRFGTLLGYGVPHTVFCHSELGSLELLQRRATDVAGATCWLDGPVVRAAVTGGLAVLDGVHRLAPGTLTAALVRPYYFKRGGGAAPAPVCSMRRRSVRWTVILLLPRLC